jgi:hypothetical protein
VHDLELVRPISSVESGFPFVALSDADEVVSSLKVDLGENMRRAQSIEEIWYQW